MMSSGIPVPQHTEGVMKPLNMVRPLWMPLHPISWVRGWVGAFVLRSAWARRQIALAAELLGFYEWQQSVLGSTRTTPTRTALWRTISMKMRSSGREWHVVELGVAFGH